MRHAERNNRDSPGPELPLLPQCSSVKGAARQAVRTMSPRRLHTEFGLRFAERIRGFR